MIEFTKCIKFLKTINDGWIEESYVLYTHYFYNKNEHYEKNRAGAVIIIELQRRDPNMITENEYVTDWELPGFHDIHIIKF